MLSLIEETNSQFLYWYAALKPEIIGTRFERHIGETPHMIFNAIVSFKGRNAYYHIESIDLRGIFEAYLTHYDGVSHFPPEIVLLIKGVGHWGGSTNDQELLYQLGCAIEKEVQRADYILPWQDRMKME